MAEKKSDEKKKKKIRRLGEPLVNVKDSVVSRVQSFSKAITNPFCQQAPIRFSEEDSDEDSSSSKDSRKSPLQAAKKSASAETIKSKSSSVLRTPTPKPERKSKKTKASLSLKTARAPRIKPKKVQNSREQLKERKRAQNKERKLREEVVKLTNELSVLQAYDETQTLLQSANSIAEELKILDGIFKGTRHAIRDLFRQSADEVQRDKEQNWGQMIALETMVGKEIETQKKLNKELDSIIERLQRVQDNKKNDSKKNGICDFITTILIIIIFVGLVAAVLYKKLNNR